MKKSSIVVIVAGIALMTAGGGVQELGELQVMAIAGGFIVTLAGIVMLVNDAQTQTRDTKTPTDVPSRVRIVGVLVALASLGLPYLRVPIPESPDAEIDRVAISFLEIAYHTAMGTGIEVEVTVLLFSMVVLAGAFVAVFHHFGGYLILFGGMGLVFVLMELLDMGPLELVLTEFEPGVWVALAGSVVIVASSFLKYSTDSGASASRSLR